MCGFLITIHFILHTLIWSVQSCSSGQLRLSTSLAHSLTSLVVQQSVLGDWATQRTITILNSASLTMINGTLCDKTTSCCSERFTCWNGRSKPSLDPQTTAERKDLRDIAGFFSKNYWGGKRLPQKYVKFSLAGGYCQTTSLVPQNLRYVFWSSSHRPRFQGSV